MDCMDWMMYRSSIWILYIGLFHYFQGDRMFNALSLSLNNCLCRLYVYHIHIACLPCYILYFIHIYLFANFLLKKKKNEIKPRLFLCSFHCCLYFCVLFLKQIKILAEIFVSHIIKYDLERLHELRHNIFEMHFT